MLEVKCAGCEKKFNVFPEIFGNYEIIFCPICGLNHQVIKKISHTTIKSIQYA
jgi:rRNA maturation endonuclease Nob1